MIDDTSRGSDMTAVNVSLSRALGRQYSSKVNCSVVIHQSIDESSYMYTGIYSVCMGNIKERGDDGTLAHNGLETKIGTGDNHWKTIE